MTQVCNKCGIEKPVEGFHARMKKCKECVNTERKEKYWADIDATREAARQRWVRIKDERNASIRANRSDEVRRKQREYYHANRERLLAQEYERRAKNPDRVKAARRRFYKEHRDQVLVETREYKLSNPDWYRKYNNEYRRSNQEAFKAIQQNARAKRRSAPGRFTRAEWKALLEICGHRCLACGSTGQLSVDHVVPLARGGSNTIDNLQPLCRSCNSKKSVKTIDYRQPEVLLWLPQN